MCLRYSVFSIQYSVPYSPFTIDTRLGPGPCSPTSCLSADAEHSHPCLCRLVAPHLRYPRTNLVYSKPSKLARLGKVKPTWNLPRLLEIIHLEVDIGTTLWYTQLHRHRHRQNNSILPIYGALGEATAYSYTVFGEISCYPSAPWAGFGRTTQPRHPVLLRRTHYPLRMLSHR